MNLFFGGYDKAIEKIFSTTTARKKVTIFTPNAEMLAAAKKRKRLLSLLKTAALPFPDGIGVYIAARMIGYVPKERTNGIDLAERILNEAATRKMGVFLLGGRPGIAEAAAKKLSERFDGIIISGTHHGYFDKIGSKNDDVIKRIDRSGAEVLFVCFGFPTQERWIADNIHKLKSVKIAAGLGGSLDVWSGKLRRAPKLFRALGIEWLWRVACEPSRIRRIPSVFKFILHCLAGKMAKSAKRKSNLLQNR